VSFHVLEAEHQQQASALTHGRLGRTQTRAKKEMGNQLEILPVMCYGGVVPLIYMAVWVMQSHVLRAGSQGM
jgi:hypothetical protein